MNELKKMFENARIAQKEYATFTQEQVDKLFYELAKLGNEERINLARMAVEETKRGILEDKVIKNHFASEFIYNKYKNMKTVGVIDSDDASGMRRIAEPVGVITAIVPVTNPTSTTIFKILMAIKTGIGFDISTMEFTYTISGLEDHPLLTVTELTATHVADYASELLVTVNGKTTIDWTVIPKVVTIGASAFLNSTLTNIAFPARVTEIKASAFQGSSVLSSLDLGSVETIGVEAFASFNGNNPLLVSNLTLPDTLTSLGEGAFLDARFLLLTIGTGLTAIPDNAFRGSQPGSITIPDNVTSVGANAFADGRLLTASIKAGTTYIKENVTDASFGAATVSLRIGTLTQKQIDDSITSSGYKGGYGKIVFDQNVIDGVSLTITTGETTSGFSDGDTIKITATAHSTNQLTITDYEFIFSDDLLADHPLQTVTTLTSADVATYSDDILVTVGGFITINWDLIPLVTTIGASAFQNNQDINSLELPSRILTVADSAFYGAPLLKVVLNDGLETIGQFAFRSLNAVAQGTPLTIPDSVTSLGEAAFEHTGLFSTITLGSGVSVLPKLLFNGATFTSIVFPTGVITSMGEKAFQGVTTDTIVIPEGVTSLVGVHFFASSKIKNITLPDSLISIGGFMFAGTTEPITVNISGSATYDYAAWPGNVTVNISQLDLTQKQIDDSVTPSGFLGGYGKVTVESAVHGVTLAIKGTKTSGFTDGDIITLTATVPFGVSLNKTEYTYTFDETGLIDHPLLIVASLSKALVDLYIDDIIVTTGSVTTINWDLIPLVTQIGTNAFLNNSDITTLSTPARLELIAANAFTGSTLTNVLLNDGLEFIGNEAFSNLSAETGQTSIVIPDSVTNLGTAIFESTTLFDTITLGSGVAILPGSLFRYATFSEIIYPSGVITSMGSNMFQNSYTTAIVIPEGVTHIGNSFFSDAKATSITLPDSLKTIGSSIFNIGNATADVYISNSATYDYAAWPAQITVHIAQDDLTQQQVDDSMTTSGFKNGYGKLEFNSVVNAVTFAFKAGEKTTGFTNGDIITLIATAPPGVTFTTTEYTYTYDDTGLTDHPLLTATSLTQALVNLYIDDILITTGSVTTIDWDLIPLVTSLDNNSFKDNEDITELVLPTRMRTIGSKAFSNTPLATVTLNEGLVTIRDGAFDFLTETTKTTDIVIPDSVTTLGTAVFSYSTLFSTITLGSGIIEIPNSTFRYAELNTVVFPVGVITSTGERIFQGAKISEIVIPEGVTSIGNYAFSSTTATSVTLPDSLTTLGLDPFNGIAQTVNVSILSVATYNTTWAANIKVHFRVPDLTQTQIDNAITTSGYTGGSGRIAINNSMSGVTLSIKDGEPINGFSDGDIIIITATLGSRYSMTTTEYEYTFDDTGLSTNPLSTATELTAALVAAHSSIIFDNAGGINWDYLPLVTSIGGNAFYNNTTIRRLELPARITSIGDSAFTRSSLNHIVLNEGLQTIESFAFRQLTNGSMTLTIPDSVTNMGIGVFRQSTAFSSITWGLGVPIVPSSTFRETSGSFVFPVGSITEIENAAFLQSPSSGGIIIPEGVTTLGDQVFQASKFNSIILPSTLTTMGTGVFDLITHNVNLYISFEVGERFNLSGLASNIRQIFTGTITQSLLQQMISTSGVSGYGTASISPDLLSSLYIQVVWANNLTTDKTGLANGDKIEVWVYGTIGQSVVKSVEYTISGLDPNPLLTATELTKELVDTYPDILNASGAIDWDVIPNVTSVGDEAFKSNTTIKSAILPARIRSIGASAFQGSVLTDLTLNAGLQTIGNLSFAALKAGNQTTSIVIPDSVTSIGTSAFQSSDIFDSFTLGSGVAVLPNAFRFSSFNSFVFPTTGAITTFGERLLQSTKLITSVVIPEGVTSIGTNTFYGSSVTSVSFPDSLTTLGASTFGNVSHNVNVSIGASASFDMSDWPANITVTRRA